MQCIMCFEYVSWNLKVSYIAGRLLVCAILLHDKWSELQCSI
jgi:hypothetical protein